MMEEAKDTVSETPEVAGEVVLPVADVAPVADLSTEIVEPVPAVEAGVADSLAPVKKRGGRPRKNIVKAEVPAALPVADEVAVSPLPVPARKQPVGKAKPAPVKAPVKAMPPVRKRVVPAPRKAPVASSAKSLPLAPKSTAAKTPAIKFPAISAAVSARKPAPAIMKDYFTMATTTEFTEKFQTVFKDAGEKARAAFEKSQASMGDVGEFAKGNVEAIVESGKILASGLQELGKGYMTEGKSAVETLTEELKGLTSVKSPTEFFEKQSALLRKQFDAAVAVSSKNSEAMLKLANEAFQPISNRVSLAVEKMKQAA